MDAKQQHQLACVSSNSGSTATRASRVGLRLGSTPQEFIGSPCGISASDCSPRPTPRPLLPDEQSVGVCRSNLVWGRGRRPQQLLTNLLL